jgi:methylenetetrahydrofolate reductase (NADPH)
MLTYPLYSGLEFAASAPPPKVSFEFFPPKNPAMEERLWQSILRLAPLQPRFVSVTYGAGGSTRNRTHETLKRLINETTLTPAAHLTCIGSTRAEIDAIAQDYWAMGIRHIVALRGDVPHSEGGDAVYHAPAECYGYASDLVAGLRRIADFDISVAAYPEKHPEAPSLFMDIEFLRRKVDVGASRAITQLFFNPDVYLRFRDLCVTAGIHVPIVPGIIPIGNFWQVKKFSAACGATIPAWIEKLFQGLEQDEQTHEMIAAAVAAEICQRLRREGVDEFHFYTLNRAGLTFALCRMLGMDTTRQLPLYEI